MGLSLNCALNFFILAILCPTVYPELPLKPVVDSFTRDSPTSAVLHWTSTDLYNTDRAPVRSYEILLHRSNVPSQVKRMTMLAGSKRKLGVRFNNLNPNSRYTIRLRAISFAGKGPWISKNLTNMSYGYAQIEIKPADQRVFEGSSVIFPCATRSTVTWLFNNTPITFGHTVKHGSLLIRDVKLGIHNGRYTCVAVSEAGNVSYSASLVVYVRVSTYVPKRRYIFSLTDGNANISCYGRGYPLPDITWKKDGLPVSANKQDKVINETCLESKLLLGAPTIKGTGNYTCQASNSIDKQEPEEVVIETMLFPAIVVKPTDQTKKQGSDVVFRFKCTGFPRPTVKWFFNDGPIPWSHTIDESGSIILKNVRHGIHDGRYTSVATNDAGTVSSSAQLVINVPPEIVVKPTDQTKKQGSNVVFRFNCTGFPRPTVKWFFNDGPIPWSHTIDESGSLILKNVRRGTHDGRYTSVATNDAGTVSSSIKLAINVPPEILFKPTDQTKKQGSDVVFRFKCTGFPRPTVKWFFNDGPIPWSHTIDESGSLILKNVRHGTHDGRYTSVATNDAGTVSSEMILSVHFGPFIYAPKRRYIFSTTSRNESTVLTCYGSSYPLSNVTWRNTESVKVNQTDVVINETFIESRLFLGDIHYAKGGNYSCSVANGVNDPISLGIEVLFYPAIDEEPTNQEIMEGSTAIFPCKALGFPRPTVTWLFDDKPIPWKHSIQNDTLVIKSVQYGKHNGRFTCVAISQVGRVSSSASLRVYVRASSYVKKRRLVYSLTSKYVYLHCYGRGYPLPNITWTKNGLPVSMEQTDSVVNETFIESQLNLGNFTREMAGNYSCYATNGLDGVYISTGVIIEALLHPIIVKNPEDQDSIEGSTVVFKCETSGSPKPTTKWLFNGKSIPFHHTIEDGSLVIEDVSRRTHAGKYTCVATSKAGTVSHSAWLFIREAYCPSGWAEGSSSCYRIVTKPTAKWNDAREFCISLGGYLVNINSAEENRYVTNLAAEFTSSTFMWIGLSKYNAVFRWTDGTSLTGHYSSWHDGEPNNAKGNENCVYLYIKGDGAYFWNDDPCNYSAFYACERGKLYH